MSTSNLNPGFSPYLSSTDDRSKSHRAPPAGSQLDEWHDHAARDDHGSYGLPSSPSTLPYLNADGHHTSHFGGDITYTSNNQSTVGMQGYGSNSHAYNYSALPPQGNASRLQLAQPVLHGQGSQGNEPWPLYSGFGDSRAYSSNTESTIGDQAYGGSDSTYHAGGYYHDNLNTRASSSSITQHTVASSVVGLQGLRGNVGIGNRPIYDTRSPGDSLSAAQHQTAQMSTAALSQTNLPHHPFHTAQGSERFERERDVPLYQIRSDRDVTTEGHSGLTYGPIPHSSLQSSNSMCFRTQSTVNRRSAPYSNIYRQERSRAPIYNGNIYGGVNNFYTSSGDVLQYLKEHAATGAMHDSGERFPPPLCHRGTREAIIHRILDWYGYQERPGKPIMWIYAPAGYGKTAVAGTVSAKLEENSIELNFNLLGATFFFWRTSADRNSPARFIITLTYQLFVSIPELAPHIESAVKRDPMILSKAPDVQLMKLIIGPFKVLGDTKDMPNRLIIIDGLDECINSDQESRVEKRYAEDQERVQIRVLDLIHTLASHSFPLSFLVFSRPEAWIKQHMESRKFKDLVEFVNLYEVGDNMNDVEKFVRDELSRLGVDEEDLVKRLVWRAGGHMLYASTVIRHIDDPYCNPRNRLQSLLTNSSSSNPDLTHSTPFSSLHELYRQILQSCPEGNSQMMIDVLGELLVRNGLLKPDGRLSLDQVVTIFDGLSGRQPGSGMRALRGLHSVLQSDRTGVSLQSTGLFIHSSFVEFLRNPHLSLDFTVHEGNAAKRLASGCLACMSSVTSYSRAPDELHVQYAVLNWAWLWQSWNDRLNPLAISDSHQCRAILLECLEMCQRLLSIDLVACFVVAFTPGLVVTEEPYFLSSIAKNGPKHILIAFLGDDIYHSEPLAQQAVLHVATSFTAAILHLLKPAHLDGGGWSDNFADAVWRYLHDVLNIWGTKPRDWSHDAVVLALKALLRESPADFVSLRQRIVERDAVRVLLSQEELDRFFDYICSDND